MAIVYVTGPVLLFIRIPGGSPVFLGTSMTAPRRVIRRCFAPVHNDLKGSQLPFDDLFAGEEAYIFADLTRWNELVYRSLSKMPVPVGSVAPLLPNTGGLAGSLSTSDLGTAMMTEGAAYQLYMRWPFYDTHPMMAANGMLAGERYLQVYFKGEDKADQGNKMNVRTLVWYAISKYNPATVNNAWVLYDNNMTGIPALAPN
jgi:hypothetical protein